jgi:hypothetical protein
MLAVLVTALESEEMKLSPGKLRALMVNVAVGLAEVEFLNVRSGITRVANMNWSPSPMSTTLDSMYGFNAVGGLLLPSFKPFS